ncbi:hypothetical protein WMF30_15240 [Sorangium sp. So ce134]
MTLTVARTTLTLKHDRSTNVSIDVTTTGNTVGEYRIEIRRRSSQTWYVLRGARTLEPWEARVAGRFSLRGVAKIDGREYYTAERDVDVQFPEYSQIVNDSVVSNAMSGAWNSTKADCTETPNRRREYGFWIYLNTTSDVYEIGTTVTGPWGGPADGASVSLPPRPSDVPADILPDSNGGKYPVASFHTHTPTTYRTGLPPGSARGVGPSGADNGADTSDDVPGVVYDYIESPAGSGSIPMQHPKEAPARLYLSLGVNRRSTPQ